MKRSLAAAVIALFALATLISAQQDKSKRPSPPASAQCKFSDSKIVKVDYSSPRAKGHKIFGAGDALVPNGQVWRTGANEATTFVTDTNLAVGGKDVPAGSYTMFTVPNSDSWTLVISKKTGEWGTDYPGEKEDLARVPMSVFKTSAPVENFTIGFDEKGTSCTMNLDWENTRASVDIFKVSPEPRLTEHEERSSLPGTAPSGDQESSPVELKEGQTPQEVEKILGKPLDVTRVKENLIYTYPTVKVFFENGKLVNVEPRDQPQLKPDVQPADPSQAKKSELDVSGRWNVHVSVGSFGSPVIGLEQHPDGSVIGRWAHRGIVVGTIEGILQGNTLTYTMRQARFDHGGKGWGDEADTSTVLNCPGTFSGTITFLRDTPSGSFEGTDCRGTIQNAVITLRRCDQCMPPGHK